jgi:2-keto-4-pentenoate hydratase/2-oxohepta-3-ene-1,7-dioic acid hydratase in catechol pathway
MRLANLARGGLAAETGGRLVDLGSALGDGIANIDGFVAAGGDAWAAARSALADADDLGPLGDVPLAAAVQRPSKIICVGLNYVDHAAEVRLTPPAEPLLFAKLPSTIAAPGQPIEWPEGLTEKVDWEGELAVVVGRPLRHATPKAALDAVFGYTAANDVTARDLQFGDGQWTRGKSLDGFCPVGPVVVTPDEIADPQALELTTRLNGEVVQHCSTADMIFSIADVLAFCSRSFTLLPGDLVLTGTPAGVGVSRTPSLYLAPGDRIEVEVEGIGTLVNPVAGPVAARPGA